MVIEQLIYLQLITMMKASLFLVDILTVSGLALHVNLISTKPVEYLFFVKTFLTAIHSPTSRLRQA